MTFCTENLAIDSLLEKLNWLNGILTSASAHFSDSDDNWLSVVVS